VCGGIPLLLPMDDLKVGLSPRVRGHLANLLVNRFGHRSIPACAGASGAFMFSGMVTGVYPRVCGGISGDVLVGIALGGLSPRVRGHQSWGVGAGKITGSIPACAGASRRRRVRRDHSTVYPRVCGGIQVTAAACQPMSGLSPRVRGHQRELLYAHEFQGSIPACAGASVESVLLSSVSKVYPRVCGGILFGGRARISV